MCGSDDRNLDAGMRQIEELIGHSDPNLSSETKPASLPGLFPTGS